MAQLDWRPMQVMDTSNYLDAIARAQANTVKGVEGIGNAFKGYHDGLKEQNTNQMLSILNQAKDQNGLVDAQQQIAALQQRFGNGYDLDKVRTAVDERPNVLLQRQTNQMEFDQKRAALDAIPQRNAMFMKLAEQNGVSPEALAAMQGIQGIDITGDISSFTNNARQDARYARQDFTEDRNYNLQADNQNFNQNLATQKFNLDQQQASLSMGKQLYDAENSSAGGAVVDINGQTISGSGGGGAANLARYASMFGPEAAGMIHTESRGDPNAVSPKGARGVIQIMPATAKNPGYGMSPINLNSASPEQQIAWGMEYKKRIQQAHGFTSDQATAAFNAGAGKVQQAIRKGGNDWLSHLPKETRDYVPRVNAATQRFASGGGSNTGGGGAVGISQTELLKVKDSYDTAKVQWNMKKAGGDPVLDPTRFDELKVKGGRNTFTTDNYQILDIMRNNTTAQQLPTASLQKVLDKATNYREDKKFGQYIDSDRLEASINSYIAAEAKHYKATRQQKDVTDSPLTLAVTELQQAYRKAGVNLPRENAIKMLDSEEYERQFAKKQVQKAQPKPKPVPSKPIVKSNGATNKDASMSDSAKATAKARELAKQVEANTTKRNEAKGIVPKKPKPVVKDTRISDVANTLFNPKPVKVPINQEWLKKQRKN